MNRIQEEITGILLAGGKSSRMGSDKGMIRSGNNYLYEYPLGILEEICDIILVSTCRDSGIPAMYEKVCDEVADAGPVAGIYTCLKKSTTRLNIVISVDMPLLNTGLFQYLLIHSAQHDIVVPSVIEGKPEPLCGIYKKEVVPFFGHLISKKDYAVHSVFPLVKTSEVLITPEMPFYRPHLFLNINRKEDLDKLPHLFSEE